MRLLVIAVCALIAGCTPAQSEESFRSVTEVIPVAPHGTKALVFDIADGTRCVALIRYGKVGGVDCDWR